MKVAIRDYHEVDFSVCCSLWEELAQHHRKIYEDPSIGGDDLGRGFELYLNNAQRRATWVAEAEGRVVACAGLIMDMHGNGEEAEIEPVIVSVNYRRKGIGAKLIRHAKEEARKSGVRSLSIRPVLRNEEAIRFFIREGFNLVGYIDLFQDISGSSYKKWKSGIVIHGNQLRY
jgi:N-acetylglutamate synthase-like GNAT family acetyltransferase